MRLVRVKHALDLSLWVVPLLWVIAGIGLSFICVAIDRASGYDLVSERLTGTPATAQTILSTIASSMVTLTSVVLSLTLVAVQLAMGQFSPRIVRAIMSDRRNQAAVGLFGATFAFSILSLRAVDEQAGVVPGLSVLVAYGLVLASVLALVFYLDHVGESLRASGLIDLVGDELRVQLDRRYPASDGPPDDPATIRADAPGTIVYLDEEGLVAVAARAGCRLEMLPMMGDFVPAGAVLFLVHGDPSRLSRDDASRHVLLGPERTHTDDPAYGFRKLVDIAERGVAQPFLDPTTAKQAIDRLHDCLRQLAPRPFPDGRYRDEDGELRLVVPMMTWDGYVRLSFDELRLAGAGSPQVTRRLVAALEDLKTVAPSERHPPLVRQLQLLEANVRRQLSEEDDIRAALTPDQLGLGSGPDLVMTGGAAAGSARLDGSSPGASQVR